MKLIITLNTLLLITPYITAMQKQENKRLLQEINRLQREILYNSDQANNTIKPKNHGPSITLSSFAVLIQTYNTPNITTLSAQRKPDNLKKPTLSRQDTYEVAISKK